MSPPSLASRISAALDLVLPPACPACGRLQTLDGFCTACALTLVAPRPRCSTCAPAQADLCAEHCPVRAVVRAGGAAVIAPFAYGGQLARAIQRLKYEGVAHVAAPLGRLLGPTLRTQVPHADLVLPVPLHRRRLVERGYNQTALLAREAARGSGLGLRFDVLARNRPTRRQAGLSAVERQSNVRGAFVADGRSAAGRRVLLVDDVMTTGATAAECVASLLAAGAAAVRVLTLARVMP